MTTRCHGTPPAAGNGADNGRAPLEFLRGTFAAPIIPPAPAERLQSTATFLKAAAVEPPVLVHAEPQTGASSDPTAHTMTTPQDDLNDEDPFGYIGLGFDCDGGSVQRNSILPQSLHAQSTPPTLATAHAASTCGHAVFADGAVDHSQQEPALATVHAAPTCGHAVVADGTVWGV